MHFLHLSQLPLAGEMGGQFEIGNTTPLRSGLEDALVLFDVIIQLLAFLNVHGTGLFTIDVLARSCGEDGGRGMPAITGRDDDCINVIP